ncbi:Nucleolar MIF4G domain-containing protein 1 [Tupaia chinensis]|uniref:Nucleolar MIF4G domain-containing protein 1 n=1 Tax=Tupaia chinensis TaxID=246437 RepID=L9L4X4_TUPCH|nr:Nucleolar MIF4G domain-containing protein 1 [Tupaia chinensis]
MVTPAMLARPQDQRPSASAHSAATEAARLVMPYGRVDGEVAVTCVCPNPPSAHSAGTAVGEDWKDVSDEAEARSVRDQGRAEARADPGKPGPSAAAAARRRALLAANEQEDREIRKLERCLGLSKRRKKGGGSSVPLSFARDGLDYILGALRPGGGWCESAGEDGGPGPGRSPPEGGLDSDSEPGSEEQGPGQSPPESDLDSDPEPGSEEEQGPGQSPPESDLDSDPEPGSEEEQGPGQSPPESDLDSDPEPGSEEEQGPVRAGPARKRVRFAQDEAKSSCVEDGDTAERGPCERGEKYVPPHVRQAEEALDVQKKEGLERLTKHVRGLINRVSEPSMPSISGQLEELYMAHSRKDMSDAITATLMAACVGAHFLEAVVRKFEDVYKGGGEGKECENLLTIVAHLYNFHVVQSLLITDILKKLIRTFTEKDVELILLVLKNVGFSLRKDDALSLKELITEAQTRAREAGGALQDQTRIRFMLETMLALKNNDMRKIPGYDPEPVEKLRKVQRALVRSGGSGSEARLRVSWDGILNAEQTGRWWIVGSAWTGAPMIDSSCHPPLQKPPVGTVSSKILELARRQRMNTDVRRNIFCTIMTSEDFLDAFEKLLKLGLKDQQEREIVHVLMDCCLQEKTYNPFYALLASKFCAYERRFQMTFQFSIWDKFRDLENLPATNFSNLVQLVAHLLKTKSLTLSILKVVEFSELDKPRVRFLRNVLNTLLMETEVEDLGLIFARGPASWDVLHVCLNSAGSEVCWGGAPRKDGFHPRAALKPSPQTAEEVAGAPRRMAWSRQRLSAPGETGAGPVRRSQSALSAHFACGEETQSLPPNKTPVSARPVTRAAKRRFTPQLCGHPGFSQWTEQEDTHSPFAVA